jgi:hypothetical protein
MGKFINNREKIFLSLVFNVRYLGKRYLQIKKNVVFLFYPRNVDPKLMM